MENDIFLCLLFIFSAGLSSQSVTITEGTVYVKENAIGHVTCKLTGNCSGIGWYLSSVTVPVAQAFVGLSCLNRTNGYYQSCDDQNHQYTLYFTGTTNLHGQTLRCIGEGCTPQQTVLDTVTIFIIVPVTSVALEGISGQQITVTAGKSKSITCVTGVSRPAPRILWYIGMTNVTSLSTETEIPSQELFYTRSTVTFIPIKSQNGLQVNCKAYIAENNIVELTTKPTLNVQYPPDDSNTAIKQGNILFITEGNNTTLVCEVRGGNPLSTITWDCFGLTGTSSTDGDISRSTLKFIAHRSYNRRTCTCRASHPTVNLGTDYVTINVYFAAKVTTMEISDGNNFTIPEHSTKTITCLAEGLPQPTITLTYISNSSIIKSVNDLRLDFTFPSARCEDTGRYRCDAINKFTPQQPLQKDVLILCQPRTAEEPLQNRYALSVGKTLNITVPYLAYPKPTFRWFKNISDVSLTQITDGEDVQINNSVINTYTYVTQLIRENIQEDSFGTYILISSNIIGTKEDVYIVGAKGKPQKPRNGKAMCINYKTAFVTWKPGFFNGDNQTFSIVYKEKGGTEQISVSNISDPGQDKYINHTVNSLQGAKTYIFTIYSRNTFGKSPAVEVNCSTKDVPESGTSTGLAVGAGLGSAIMVIIIIVLIVVIVARRFKGGLTKGKRDVEMKGRSALTSAGEQEDEMRDNVSNEPSRSNVVKAGSSVGAIGGISGGATGGQNDYPYAAVQKSGQSGLDNSVTVYAEVQKIPKKDKKPGQSAVHAVIQKPKKEDKGGKGGAKPKENKTNQAVKTVAVDGTLYENMDDINAKKKNEMKKPKAPKNKTKSSKNKDSLIYADIIHESKPNGESRPVIHGLENKTDYAEVDFNRSGNPLQTNKSNINKQEPANI